MAQGIKLIYTLNTEDHADYDLVVIGGGIQGAGVARDAALRGLKVLLCEKNDFGSATSSNSSKLVHGGLRYLESYEFKLVAESLRERWIQYRSAPHLVQPLRIVIPFYKKSKRPAWMLRLGLSLYDLLAYRRQLKRHQKVSAATIERDIPCLKVDAALGGVEFTDCQMDDLRLVLENIVDAQDLGAVCLNHANVTNIEQLASQLYQLTYNHRAADHQVTARAIVNASGPWVEEVLGVSPERSENLVTFAKGIHLLIQSDVEIKKGAMLQTKSDGRFFFVLPWYDYLLVGTTDTACTAPDQTTVTKDDVEYLTAALRDHLSSSALTSMRIVGTFSGIRPLAYQANKNTRATSRDYKIVQRKGIWTVIGGKYTVYRSIAENIVDQIAPLLGHHKPCATRNRKLPGAPDGDWQSYLADQTRQCSDEFATDATISRALICRYGKRWRQVLDCGGGSLIEPLYPGSRELLCEALFATQVEGAGSLDDVVLKRLHLGRGFQFDSPTLDKISTVLQDVLQLDDTTLAAQKRKLLTEQERFHNFIGALQIGK